MAGACNLCQGTWKVPAKENSIESHRVCWEPCLHRLEGRYSQSSWSSKMKGERTLLQKGAKCRAVHVAEGQGMCLACSRHVFSVYSTLGSTVKINKAKLK